LLEAALVIIVLGKNVINSRGVWGNVQIVSGSCTCGYRAGLLVAPNSVPDGRLLVNETPSVGQSLAATVQKVHAKRTRGVDLARNEHVKTVETGGFAGA
jgi:hypothetical protein